METKIYLDGNLNLAFNKQKIFHFPEETRILFYIEIMNYYKHIFIRMCLTESMDK